MNLVRTVLKDSGKGHDYWDVTAKYVIHVKNIVKGTYQNMGLNPKFI